MNRFKQIDILRALAVFLVLGRHLLPCPAAISPFLNQITRIWIQGGWIGVDLFFVLSGFLVSGLLFREFEKHHQLRIGNFLIRRGFKIYPPFWVMTGVTIVLAIRQYKQVPWLPAISELLFVQNYGPALWRFTWSLAVEEHFYLLLALGFFILAKHRPAQPFRSIPVAFIAVAVICLTLRLLVAACIHGPFDLKLQLFPSHLRMDSLFFGVLLSYLYHNHPKQFLSIASRFRFFLLCLGVLMLAPAFCLPLETTPFLYTYGLTLFYLGSGCLLVSALGLPPPSSRFATAIAYLGSHSYSVYLWHMPVGRWGIEMAERRLGPHYNWFVYAGVYLVGAVVFGVVMATLIEFPVLRIRDRFFPSRGNPLGTNAMGSVPAVPLQKPI